MASKPKPVPAQPKPKGVFLSKDMIRFGCLGAYALVGVLTYGALAANADADRCRMVIHSEIVTCVITCHSDDQIRTERECSSFNPLTEFIGPIIAGAIWPIYWTFHASYKLFEK